MSRVKIGLPSQTGAVQQVTQALTNTTPENIPEEYLVVVRQDSITSGTQILTQPLEVRAHLPEEMQVDTQSDYDTPFAEGLIGNRQLQLLAQLAGWSPTVQSMTAHFWKGSSPIEISLPLTLVAQSSGNEITEAVLMLKTMQMPSIDGDTGFLRAPGPRLEIDTAAAKRLWTTVQEGASAAAGIVTGNVIGDSNAQGTKLPANSSDVEQLSAVGRRFGTEFAASAEGLIKVSGKISISLGKFLYFPDVVIRGVSDMYNITIGHDGLPQRATVTIQAVTRMTPTIKDLPTIYRTDPPEFILSRISPSKADQNAASTTATSEGQTRYDIQQLKDETE